MKVMVSQPMAGKTVEEIEAERAEVVKRIEAAGHEYVDTVIDATSYARHKGLWCLGAALQYMSFCDACVFMRGWDAARGCRIEHAAALAYGVEVWMENDLPEAKRMDND